MSSIARKCIASAQSVVTNSTTTLTNSGLIMGIGGNTGGSHNGNNITKTQNDELSPTSSLRLNFDQMSSENVNENDTKKILWGLPMPPFVTNNKVVSWIEDGLIHHEEPIIYNGINVVKRVRVNYILIT